MNMAVLVVWRLKSSQFTFGQRKRWPEALFVLGYYCAGKTHRCCPLGELLL